MAAAGAAAALPMSARAEGDSIFDMFSRNRALREADREGNIAAAEALIQTVEPILSYDTAYNLQYAISQYEPFVAAGGWEIVPQEVYGLVLGNSKKSVIALKRRLIQSGDMPPAERVNDVFDNELDKAVKTFQARHGLNPTGQVDEQTYYALIVPADVRLIQLRLNLARVGLITPTLSDRYVVINIPAATIEAVQGGSVERRHPAVVGKIDRQTPILHSKIHQISFNPY